MKIEHIAINVPDAQAFAQWYVEHLGLRIVRAQTEAPFITFLADDENETIIEVFSNPLGTYVEYGTMHPVTLHLAFTVADMEAERDRLLAAGAAVESQPSPAGPGDKLGFVRDPWGIAIQLVQRKQPLV